MLLIKICGMRESANIEAVAELKPDLMGFIFYPKSKRYVSDNLNSSLLQKLMPEIETVGVFVNESLEKVVDISQKYGFASIQLHGNESPEYCIGLKKNGIKIMKAFGIHSGFDWNSLMPYQNVCDYFLFDTSTKDYGGSGRKFEWNILDKYQGLKSFFLSGGIGSEDVDNILSLEHPNLAGIDINSGFEIEPGLKDVNLLKDFLNKIKNT